MVRKKYYDDSSSEIMIRQHRGEHHVTAHVYRSFKFGDWQEKFHDFMSFSMCNVSISSDSEL